MSAGARAYDGPLMRELQGFAFAAVDAPPDKCMALLEAVDRYPEWHLDVVQEVEVLARNDGHPTRVRTKLHLARGPLVKNFNLVMAVASDRMRQVKLTKVRDVDSGPEQFEVTWLVEDTGPPSYGSTSRPTSTCRASCRSAASATGWPRGSSPLR